MKVDRCVVKNHVGDRLSATGVPSLIGVVVDGVVGGPMAWRIGYRGTATAGDSTAPYDRPPGTTDYGTGDRPGYDSRRRPPGTV